jgi:hypothetical protein
MEAVLLVDLLTEETMSQSRFRGIHEESDFSFGSDYIRDDRAYRPSRLSRQSGSRSWVGVGESSFSGDQGGRSYSSGEYNENPSYAGTSNEDSRFGQTRPSFAGRGPQGYKRSDERIIEDINEHLTQDHDVDASGICVECRNGEVVLTGTVTDRDAKRRAEDIAEWCSGVKDVQNQLRIQRHDFSASDYEVQRSDEKRTKAN